MQDAREYNEPPQEIYSGFLQAALDANPKHLYEQFSVAVLKRMLRAGASLGFYVGKETDVSYFTPEGKLNDVIAQYPPGSSKEDPARIRELQKGHRFDARRPRGGLPVPRPPAA